MIIVLKSFTFILMFMTLIMSAGCYDDKANTKEEVQKEKFYGIEMLGRIDSKKFQLSNDNNDSQKIKRFSLIGQDDLFDSVQVVTDKNNNVLSINLNKDVGQFGDPYSFANQIYPNLETKYGKFRCISSNVQFFGKIGENCTKVFKDNIISFHVFHFSNQRSVTLKYENIKLSEFDKHFKDKLSEIKSESKL